MAKSGCSASPSTGTPKHSAGMSPSAAIATLPSRPSVWRSGKSSATSTPAPLAAWRCVMITAARSSPNTSTTRSASGGMTPSYAFVGEPETNGVIERFFRTLKEQIVHGRIYQTIDEVRDAVRDFVARYNAEWLIEKNGLRSPDDTRAAWYQTGLKAAA